MKHLTYTCGSNSSWCKYSFHFIWRTNLARRLTGPVDVSIGFSNTTSINGTVCNVRCVYLFFRWELDSLPASYMQIGACSALGSGKVMIVLFEWAQNCRLSLFLNLGIFVALQYCLEGWFSRLPCTGHVTKVSYHVYVYMYVVKIESRKCVLQISPTFSHILN